MKKLSIKHQLIVFLLTCLFSIPLTVLGLRHYFDDARLKEQLSLTYVADDFKLVIGHAKIARSATRSTLLIDDIEQQQQQKNIVKLPNLAINTQFYDEVLIHFAEKQRFQPINTVLRYRDMRQTITYPILYTNKLTSRIPLDKKIETGAILSELQLATDNLFSTYRIESVEFVPKRLELNEFIMLIARNYIDFSDDEKRLNIPTFMQLKFVLFIYFSVAAMLFACYLLWRKNSVLIAFWTGLVMVWIVYDAIYLIQRTQHSALVKLVDGDKSLLDKLFDGEKYFVKPTSLKWLTGELDENDSNADTSNKKNLRNKKKLEEKADKKTDMLKQEALRQEEEKVNDGSEIKIQKNDVQKVSTDEPKQTQNSPSTKNSPITEELPKVYQLPDIVLESLSDFEDEDETADVTEQGDSEPTKEQAQ